MDKAEKKQLAKEYAEKGRQEFLAALPIPPETFQKLFDYLDKQSEEKECNHNFDLTLEFLMSHHISAEPLLNWLRENGAGCDCEIIFNIEEQFEEFL